MGVGAPEDLVRGVLRGVDIFDCVLPTRLARHGSAMIKGGRLNLRNAQYRSDDTPCGRSVQLLCVSQFSRAYLRHLVQTNEILGHILLSTHNLHFLINLMAEIRKAHSQGNAARIRSEFLRHYRDSDS